MSERVLLTGANGMLGVCVCDALSSLGTYTVTATTRKDLDLSDPQSIERFFAEQQFDIIINCAAYTAVDKAESEPELAEQVNHLAVAQIAAIAKAQDSLLIHISTDYVFDGKTQEAYREDDTPKPINVYGRTKAAGEQAVMGAQGRAVIIRTSWIYAEHGHNFVRTILRIAKEKESLQIVNDQFGTPTYARGIASAVCAVLAARSDLADAHIYHYSDEGVASWYDFGKEIVALAEIDCEVVPTDSSAYPQAAKRPAYSTLDKSKIGAAFGVEILPWREQLARCIERIEQ